MATNRGQSIPQGKSGLLGHISFGVRSYEVSKRFYTALLKPLGADLVFDDPDRKILGYGFDPDNEIINVFESGLSARSPGPGTHFAFNAPNREAVRRFWNAGIANGGEDSGAPGVRDAYGEHYYAAFLFDPDGFKLEAVFQEPGVEDGHPDGSAF